jgi:hypothetical protein
MSSSFVIIKEDGGKMAIGLCDIDSKTPNTALRKLSTFFKEQGEEVEFCKPDKKYRKIYGSAIFTKSKSICDELKNKYGDLIELGGTGWDFEEIDGKLIQVRKNRLAPEIEKCKPDYDLYTASMIYPKLGGIMTKETRLKKAQVIADAGMGFTSKGCIRRCKFCIVPICEGCLHQVAEIKDLLNPRSNVLILNDNNITADPYCIDKLHEIRDRHLVCDINQGLDIRLVSNNDNIAQALSEVQHLRHIHYAWDLMEYEDKVLSGIKTLSKYVRPYRQMCYMLVGFNTTFEEDVYRFRKLKEIGIDPYVMIYNEKDDKKLKHFGRWVNTRIYKTCKFEEYIPWIKTQSYGEQLKLAI